MSYPKKCDKCDQFESWCFCEPLPPPDGPWPDAPDVGDLYVPEMWATEANRILSESMVIAVIEMRKFDAGISECLDQVRINRGVK